MKKTYINPDMLVVKIQTTHMLASSPEQIEVDGTPTDPSGSDARDGDFDED